MDVESRSRARSVTAAKPLEPGPRLVVDPVAQPAGRALAMHASPSSARKRRRAALAHLLPARAADGGVGRHEQHGSRSRCSAARRSSTVSACGAKRTSSGPTSRPRPRRRRRRRPARPAGRRSSRARRRAASRSAKPPAWKQVRPVEQVQRGVARRHDLELEIELRAGAGPRRACTAAATLHVQRLDAGARAGSRRSRRRCAARADAHPFPRRRRRARRRRVRSASHIVCVRRPRRPRRPRGRRSSPPRGTGRGSGTTATGRCSTAPADERQTAGVTVGGAVRGDDHARRAGAGRAADHRAEVARVGDLVEAGRAAALSAAASSHASA